MIQISAKRSWILQALFSLLLFGSFSYCACGQTISLQGNYVESFVGKPKVSGNLLVGLRLGDSAGNFDPKAVGLLIPSRAGWRSACVDISSRDGRYFAQNLYKIDPASGGVVNIPARTSYSDQLKRYDTKDIAVTVRLVSDCNAPEEGEIVPAMMNSSPSSMPKGEQAKALVAYLNADPDRLKVALLRNHAQIAQAACKSEPNAVQISFTSSCEFKGGASVTPGSYDLLIQVRERFAWRDSHFSIRIP